jgi:hypothetical protein
MPPPNGWGWTKVGGVRAKLRWAFCAVATREQCSTLQSRDTSAVLLPTLHPPSINIHQILYIAIRSHLDSVLPSPSLITSTTSLPLACMRPLPPCR